MHGLAPCPSSDVGAHYFTQSRSKQTVLSLGSTGSDATARAWRPHFVRHAGQLAELLLARRLELLERRRAQVDVQPHRQRPDVVGRHLVRLHLHPRQRRQQDLLLLRVLRQPVQLRAAVYHPHLPINAARVNLVLMAPQARALLVGLQWHYWRQLRPACVTCMTMSVLGSSGLLVA